MKRILVLALALIFAVGTLVVPSYAAETEFSTLVDLLSFSLPNGGDSKSVLMSPGSIVTFDLPYGTTVYYVDFVVRTDFANMQVTSLTDGVSLTTEYISAPSGTLYRVYGKLNGYTLDQLRLRFDGSSGGTVVFESFMYSSLPVFGTEIAVSGFLSAAGHWIDLYHSPNTEPTHGLIRIGTSDLRYDFSAGFRLNDWKDYDYIDISVDFYDIAVITSIVCRFATSDGDNSGTYIPLEYSYLGSSFYRQGAYEMVIRIDLRDLDRTTSHFPVLVINGEHGGSYCEIYINNAVGGLVPSNVNPVVLLLQKLTSNLSGWFTNLGLNISTGIQNVINTMNTNTQNIADFLFGEFNRLIAAVTGTGDTDGFQDQVDDQGDRLDQMDEALNSVTKPVLDRVDTNISGIVSDTDLANTAHVYTYIIDDNIMAPALTMVTILAMMSFALFGKR